jgi:diguanylate cyclase (GGDEF)-like protein
VSMGSGWLVLGTCVVLGLPTAVAPGSALARVAYLLGMAVLVAALWRGSRACTGPARRGWTLIALVGSGWLAGDTLQRVVQAVTGSHSEGVTPSDAFWLACYPLLAAAVIVMLRGRGLDRAVLQEIWLDVAAVTAVAAIASWRLMILPSLTGLGGLEAVVWVLYPVGDIMIIALAMTLVLAPGRRGVPSLLVIGCLLATFGMDCFYSVQATLFPAVDPERFDALLLVVNGLLGAAALHPQRAELAERVVAEATVRTMHRWRVLLLGLAMVVCCLLEALPAAGGPVDRFVLVSAAVVVSVSVVLRFYGVVRERESAQSALLHQASHDQLTGLANRALLLERLGAAVLGCDGEGSARLPDEVALLYLDLDGFKVVNDTWGHAAGDAVLRAVAERLRGLTRREDTVARVGGDEFVILCPGLGADDAETLGRRVRDAIRAPVPIVPPERRRDDVPAAPGVTAVLARVGVSVGVFTTGAGADRERDLRLDLEQLLRAADSAMYEAKSGGGGVHSSRLTA